MFNDLDFSGDFTASIVPQNTFHPAVPHNTFVLSTPHAVERGISLSFFIQGSAAFGGSSGPAPNRLFVPGIGAEYNAGPLSRVEIFEFRARDFRP